eukprot:39125-Eustigmatos_ZCMA.PRE.1
MAAVATCGFDCPSPTLLRAPHWDHAISMKLCWGDRICWLAGSRAFSCMALSPIAGMQDISGNRNMRCNNCPTKGCYNCPMYSVGENPEYQK